jgi:hypothetical protein
MEEKKKDEVDVDDEEHDALRAKGFEEFHSIRQRKREKKNLKASAKDANVEGDNRGK